VLTNPAGINSIGITGVIQAIETVLVPQPTSHFLPPR
jgi:hypothetical protein